MRAARILRASGLLLLTSALSPAVTRAQSAGSITGVYVGTYQCPTGTMDLKLAIVATDDRSARGRFTFAQPNSSGGVTGSFNLKGHYDPATGKFKLDPLNWNPPVPPGFPMLGVDGSLDARTGKISGDLTGGCSTFQAARNEEESAALPKQAPAPPSVGGGSATPAAQPAPSRSSSQD